MAPKTKPAAAVTAAAARMILAEHNSTRATKCRAAIQAALKRYSCIMVPETIITGDQITSSIRILPRPEQPDAAGQPANNGRKAP